MKQALDPLELKARSLLIKDRLSQYLPSHPNESFKILVESLKKNEADPVGLSGFKVWPLTQFVAEHGIEHFELSMQALYAMTKVFSAEFAIRPFLRMHELKTLQQLTIWSKDSSEDVRRLVSEGSRPLLPWGERLPNFVADPEKTWPLLDALRQDKSMYVRKSVANHLNDHSKNHGDWLIKKLRSWPESPETLWIIRHSTRTLVKKGHKGALGLHGLTAGQIKLVKQKLITRSVKLGQQLEAEVTVSNPTRRPIKVLIDQQVLFLKANGQNKPKVFKGKKALIAAGETRTFNMRLPLKKVTTRKYYFGRQMWRALINGELQKPLSFELTK